MQIVGITGGIGSGKSTIAEALRQRGFTVYDCDQEAKRIIVEDEAVRKAIVGLLGDNAYVDGKYNTAYVAQRVFEDSSLREQLNAIVHPAVEQDIRVKQPDFVESAILYESGLDKLCQKVIVVDAPDEVRIARTIARDYAGEFSEDNINKVRARMRAQVVPAGDLKIWNDGKESIAALVEKITHWM